MLIWRHLFYDSVRLVRCAAWKRVELWVGGSQSTTQNNLREMMDEVDADVNAKVRVTVNGWALLIL